MDGAKLFADVRFVLAQCNNPDELKHLLLEGGAKHINYLSDIVTHVIADINCPEAEEAVELFDKPVVTSLWVHLCLKAKIILPPEAFSPTRQIFNGVYATFSRDLSQEDIETLAATITFNGGKVTKDLLRSTHLIAISAKPNDFADNSTLQNHNIKLVAPDWILDSVRQKNRCDEVPYEPGLLLGPPPPTPSPQPTPPAAPLVQQQQPATVEFTQQTEPQSKDKDIDDSIYRPQSQNILNDQANRRTEVQSQRPMNTSQTIQHRQSGPHMQQQFQQQVQMQTAASTQIPRRMGPNMINRPPGQPRFRPILPPDPNMPINSRQTLQVTQPMIRPLIQDQRKLSVDYNNSFRKTGPYQNGPEMPQHMPQQPATQPYQTIQHVPMQQPHQVNIVGQHPPSRIPQPNIYHQPGNPYPNNQMQPRMNINQPQMNQPMHPINRFQDPNSQVQQRPYQVYTQPPQQQVGSNYHQGTVHRQPGYFAQGPANHMPMRPQQVPLHRPISHNDPNNFQDGYGQHQIIHHESAPMPQSQLQYQPPYQNQPSHMPMQQHPQQPRPPSMQQNPQFQQQSHTPQVVMQSRQQLVQQSVPTGVQVAIREPRVMQPIHQPHQSEIRQPSTSQIPIPQQTRAPRAPLVQPQPHPSIFDNKQENNLSQLRAKVPTISEDIKYFGHDLNEKVPAEMPFVGCKFKMIEYSDVRPEDRMLWVEAIEEAGGAFVDDTGQLTHLICETRLTDDYAEALKNGVRCVTVYWINDVIAQSHLKYPWKALHLPKWFKSSDKPLKDQLISTTNIKGRERREVVEMIIKSGAIYTATFCQKNTLLICGTPGGEKYERAIVWRTPMANCQILVDFLLSETKFSDLLPMAKYQNFSRTDLISVDSYSRIRKLMSSWTKPITVPDDDDKNSKKALTNGLSSGCEAPLIQQSEDSGIATSGSNNSDGDGSIKMSTSPSIETDQKTVNDNTATIERPMEKDDVFSKNDDKGNNHTSDQITKSEQSLMPGEPKGNFDDKNTTVNTIVAMDASEIKENQGYMIAMVADENDKSEEDSFVDCKETQFSEPSCSQVETNAASRDNMEILTTSTKPLRTSNEPVRLLFTRLEKKLVIELQSYALDLKLGMATSPNDCTHLIVDRISRTPKFICALNHTSYVLNYKWLIESHEIKQVLDEKAFILQDSEGEEKFSFSLVRSLLKRRRRAGKLLFTNYVFFVTPTVITKVLNLKEMIESAGGTMITRKLPNKVQLNAMRSNGKRFIVVTNQQDFHLVSSIEAFGVDIVGSEFIISGILRQDIDFVAHRLESHRAITDSPTRQTNQSVHSPAKKLRVG